MSARGVLKSCFIYTVLAVGAVMTVAWWWLLVWLVVRGMANQHGLRTGPGVVKREAEEDWGQRRWR